ncbi:MAG: adenylate/guanylate cyclase domain-containing protein, partial [Rhodanobacteraceae bacterium]
NEIIGYAELLQEEATDRGLSALLPDLQKIDQAARHLLDLVFTKVVATERPGAESAAVVSTFVRPEPRLSEELRAVRLSTEPGILLVVDDNEENRDMLSRRLQRLGHQVTLAESGCQALDRIRSTAFDLVLLDIVMPGMDGFQVIEHLKSDPALRALPIIVLSASDDSASVVRCIQMGAEDHLRKPFDPVLLQARINACLEKKRFRDREETYLRQIQEEKQRTDDLLRIILPSDVAEELKATNGVVSRRFENVGVLFSDIVGFTAFSDRHLPEEIVTHLQSLVETFEQLATRHGLEKIKTIGDAFMATAGLRDPLENPAVNCVGCALEMISAAQAQSPHWQVRVGVHVGPVVAGVVGREKYQYDVWGDTVNTASRMEQSAVPGSVCVNAATLKLLNPSYHGHSQGIIQIKGKGAMELFRIQPTGDLLNVRSDAANS